MFRDESLEEHLKTSSTVNVDSLVIAEWNLNVSENILQTGNYRYRPLSEKPKHYQINPSFDLNDESLSYTGATDSDITIDGGFDDENKPLVFTKKREKEKMLYSLEECLARFRPRSGINKLRYFVDGYTHFPNEDMARRPRFYMADRTDPFKYWTSFRTEELNLNLYNLSEDGELVYSDSNIERGIANQIQNEQYYIDDAAPYVVYKEEVPANRIVVKMQTGVGDISLGSFANNNGAFTDPFFGYQNQKTPVNWKIQYLKEDNWIDAVAFNSGSIRKDGSNIIGPDGYVELGYGLIVPDTYKAIFRNTGITVKSQSLLPPKPVVTEGHAYFIKESDSDQGRFAIVIESAGKLKYAYFNARYGWYLEEADAEINSNFVTDLTNPDFYNVSGTKEKFYREFMLIRGIRIVVETMNVFDSTFDLIEFSPRLKANISDKVVEYSVSKSASDIGISGMPVGQLLASTGKMTIFDYDQAFFRQNTQSIINKYISQHLQIKFFEIVKDVDFVDYYIPIKTMYADGLPEISNADRTVSLQLRDLFFYFESMTAPQLFLQEASLSSAISIMLDYCGFSNYSFKRNIGEPELIIPYFYVAPDKTVAEVLSDLAVSAQAAMFFDENNFLVVMSKNYIMPSIEERNTDITLYGSKDLVRAGKEINKTTSKELANIVEIAQQDNKIFNDGAINYTSSYIQKTYSSIRQASMIDRDKTWIYKPSLLWEVSPDQRTKSINEELGQQSDYLLSAIPLNTDLTNEVPQVVNSQIVNNIIDFGDGVYWAGRYNGYFYANGEVIKYDAVEYSIPGLSAIDAEAAGADGNSVWISNVQEYQKYFAKMPFNGKMYPTGRVRIYSEPNYETVGNVTKLQNGPMAKHGRGQFDTKIVNHSAGVSEEWTSERSLRGVRMENKYLFSNKLEREIAGAFTETINRSLATFNFDYYTDVPVTIFADRMSSPKHGLKVGEAVAFNSTVQLPTQLTNNKVYYVKTVINEDEFTVSETLNGTQITISGTQSGYQTWKPVEKVDTKAVTISFTDIPNQTGEAALFTTTVEHNLDIGDRVFFTTTGSLPSDIVSGVIYRVASVPDEAGKTFEVESEITSVKIIYTTAGTGTHSVNKVATPLAISCDQHGFFTGDLVKFAFNPGDQTTGYSFPSGIDASTVFEVSSTGLSISSFMLRTPSSEDGLESRVIAFDGGVGRFIAKSTITESDAKKIIVLPDVDGISVGMNVESISGTGLIEDNTKVTYVDNERNKITIDKKVREPLLYNYTDPTTGLAVTNIIKVADRPTTVAGIAGLTGGEEKTTSRTGLVKNSMSNSYLEDGQIKRIFSTQSGTVQSSALILNGSPSALDGNTPNMISYVTKELDEKFTHFGTRMRIVGQINDSEVRGQSVSGSNVYYTASPTSSEQTATITGASGGMGILIDTKNNINNGYYLELVALSESNITKYAEESIHDVIFYKLQRDAAAEEGTAGNNKNAIPVKLWGGLASITVDTGLFAEQARMQGTEDVSIYDVSIEYEEGDSGYLKFYIYINNKLIAIVYDRDPLPNYKANNTIALFTRGGSRVMFDNVYALGVNYSQNTIYKLGSLKDGVFGNIDINSTTAFQKYALSGMIQDTYLSGISSNESPNYNIYFDEFGTIMREAAFMRVRYDKAYPALSAQIAPTFNKAKGYVISGFTAGAFGAEFLIFNATDTSLNLDSTSGNYLRILGITLTQQSTHELTVDEYFSRVSDLSDPTFVGDSLITSPVKSKSLFNDIKFSRITNGKNEFSIQTPYIQSQDAAEDMMDWMIKKVMSPRKAVGVRVFAMPIIQLGDIVTFDYTNSNGVNEIADSSSRFVVYSIEYSRSGEGPSQVLYLSEVK
jgi:hypothetical protein